MAKIVNWIDFQSKLSKRSIFTPLDVRREFGVSKQTATLAVHRYKKRGLIESLRKGYYTFPKTELPDPYIANTIYAPSYVSLEFALSYHGVIPETIYTITSVTTKATRTFRSRGKIFLYRRVTKKAYTGYHIVRRRNLSFAIADAEKAFIDLTYLRLRAGMKPLSRWNKEKINAHKALKYARLFRNSKLIAVITTTFR